MTKLKTEMKDQGYTAVLNWWFDDLMPIIPNDELRLLLRINRLIVGMDTMRVMQGKGSISQHELLGETTGINRKNNIVAALRNLISWNVLQVVEKGRGGRNNRGTKYEIIMNKSAINWHLIEAEYSRKCSKNSTRFSANSKRIGNTNDTSELKESVTLMIPESNFIGNTNDTRKTLIYAFVEAQKAILKEKAIYIIFNIDLLINLIKEKNINLTTDLTVELMLSLINLIKEKNCENLEMNEWLELTHIQEKQDLSKQSNSTNLSINSVDDFFNDLYSEELHENAVELTEPVFAENSLPFVSAVINENEPEMKTNQAQLTFIDENELQRNSSDGQIEDREVGENDQLKEREIVVNKPSRKKSIVNGAAQKNAENAVTDSKPRKTRKANTESDLHLEWRKMAYNALLDERGGIDYIKIARARGEIKKNLEPLMINHGLTLDDIRNLHRIIRHTNLNGNNPRFKYAEVYPIEIANMFVEWVKDGRKMPKGVDAWIDPTAVQAEPEKPKRKVLANSERYIE